MITVDSEYWLLLTCWASGSTKLLEATEDGRPRCSSSISTSSVLTLFSSLPSSSLLTLWFRMERSMASEVVSLEKVRCGHYQNLLVFYKLLCRNTVPTWLKRLCNVPFSILRWFLLWSIFDAPRLLFKRSTHLRKARHIWSIFQKREIWIMVCLNMQHISVIP